MAKKDFAAIVKSYRGRQLAWDEATVTRLDRVLNNAATDVKKVLQEYAGTGKLQEAHAQALLDNLNVIQANLAEDTQKLLDIQLLGAAQTAAEGQAAIMQKALDGMEVKAATTGIPAAKKQTAVLSSGMKLQVSFGHVAEAAVEAVYARVQDGLTLSNRLWQNTSYIRKGLENRVTEAVMTGQDPRKLAKEISRFLTEKGKENARYHSMRLARTEVNTAFREGHIRAACDDTGQLKDHIQCLGWRLSASHPKADICDRWAGDDDHGLGPGNYPPDMVPVDHPHGLCFVVSILKAHPDMQFVAKQPRPDLVDKQGKYIGPKEAKPKKPKGSPLPKKQPKAAKPKPEAKPKTQKQLEKAPPAKPAPKPAGPSAADLAQLAKEAVDQTAAVDAGPVSAGTLDDDLRRMTDWLDKAQTWETKAQAKARICAQLAERLRDDPDFDAVMVHQLITTNKNMSVAEVLAMKADPVAWHTQRVQACSDIVHNWAESSADSRPWSIAMQMTVKDEFALSGCSSPWRDKEAVAKAKEIRSTCGGGLRSIARAMYDQTQEAFRQAGITEVQVVRGMGLPKKIEGLPLNGTPGKAMLKLQPISSFSTDPHTAGWFCSDHSHDPYRYMLQARVPVSRIFACSNTGLGCKSEAEIVVMGGRDVWNVVGWTKAQIDKTGRWTLGSRGDTLDLLARASQTTEVYE